MPVLSDRQTLRSRLNPIKGTAEWLPMGEEYDFVQEIARSAYADMLHDTERNVAFHAALKAVITRRIKSGLGTSVLDIGTGTGLLAMMASSAGAERVVAVETFQPMAITAQKIFDANGFSDIQLIKQRSTDVGEGAFERCDICVAEVFDTELIGEGALRTFAEAHERLLNIGADVIPAKASLYVLPIESSQLRRFHNAPSTAGVCVPGSYASCSGSPAVHDLQATRIKPSEFKALSKPVLAFEFDFCSSIEFKRTNSIEIVANSTASVDAFIMWWTLDMDGSGNILLSTEPSWSDERQWRDHWMQAIYYPPEALAVESGASFVVDCFHDEHSLWFNARSTGGGDAKYTTRPLCSCGLHTHLSRACIGRLNDPLRHRTWSTALSALPSEVTSCLVYSDCSLLSLLAKKCRPTLDVTAYECNPHYGNIVSDYADANGFSIDVVSIMDSVSNVQLLIADPFFSAIVNPWDALIHLWYKVEEMKCKGTLSKSALVLPSIAQLMVLPVELHDLWKIRAPVGKVEGFDLSIFDPVIQNSIRLVDEPVETHHMWEYGSTALTSPYSVAKFDIQNTSPSTGSSQFVSKIPIAHAGKLNALIFWVNWHLSEKCVENKQAASAADHTQSNLGIRGLRSDCEPGSDPDWDPYTQQGVLFLPQPFREVGLDDCVTVTVEFDPQTAKFSFHCS